MDRKQRSRYEMFGRVTNFGNTHRSLFPESSVAGKLFGALVGFIASIDEQLVRRGQAQAEARKVRVGTRRAVLVAMKAIAATGRRVVADETGPHPFRMPSGVGSIAVLAAGRLFKTEAERRQEKFVELGMRPTFLADFTQAIDALAAAVAVQQNSRAARRTVSGALAAAFEGGMQVIADLDVVVPNTLADSPALLAGWTGARRVEHTDAVTNQGGQATKDAPTPPPPATTEAA